MTTATCTTLAVLFAVFSGCASVPVLDRQQFPNTCTHVTPYHTERTTMYEIKEYPCRWTWETYDNKTGKLIK